MVVNAARLYAATWSKALVEDPWGSEQNTIVAASSNKPMKAQQIEGGFQVEGHNSFASGCRLASWF